MAGNGNTAFRFRVTLRLDGRECWREILVPASLTFFDLHAVLQECFMWYGEHLFCFCATFPNGKQVQVEELWGEEPSYHEARYEQYMPVEPLPEVRIASETELGDVFPKARAARYYYDYGDDWIHDIKLLRTYRSVHVADPQLWDGGGGMRLRRMSAGRMGSSGSLIPWAIPKMKNMMARLSGPRTRCGIVSR